MKKIFKVFCIALALFLLVGLVSCKGKELGGKEDNNLEKQIAEALEKSISSFKDPNSVAVVAVTKISGKNRFVEIKLSGKNSYGGTVTNEYYLILKSFDCDQALFDEMFAEKKNEVYDGGSGKYDNWYEFYLDFYGPDGSYEYLFGMNFFEFSYSQGDLWEIHEDSDDFTKGEYMLNDIGLYTKWDYSPSLDIGKINEYLNEYKEEMGWR